ncbi:peptide chain release factor 1-like, mitochondrial isoform X1 [Dermacentor albipictus]|uniref:peptide chain release factor 1-like, mitochondrial isoform X1 n=1 Tax=Dermacentor albipictus TaxID=60249 RepID=UPI0031FDEA24
MAASLTRRRALSGLRVVSDQQIFLKQSLRTTELCRALRTGVLRHSILHRVTHSASFWTRSVAALTPLDRRHFATLPEKDALAVDPKLLLKYFQVVAKELKDVEKELLRRSLDAKKTKELNDKVARLSGIVRLFEKVNQLRKEVDGLKDLEKDFAKTGDDEMLTMALEDLKKCETEINHIYDQILEQIVPPDPVDSSEVLLELTAGVGGQEAMLFTRDIMEMYMHYCRWKGWSCTPLDYETADQGGVRHASLNIGGRDVGKFLKFESGVHRVQRVPATEKSGRIHTSTMAVAVMPMPSEVEVVISPKDLVVKTKRASGPGGQHVNKTESAVQMQHIPTGIMVESSQERSQLTNRELALKILRAKLYQMELDKQLSQHSAQRKLQVGSRGRSEKIRTYNYAQDRVTDHRIPITVHNIEEFLQGEQQLDNVIQRLLQESRKEIVLEVLQPVVK